MTRIIHFISDSNVGGAGKLLCNLIATMDPSEFETFVALPKESALIERLSDLPCKVIKLRSSPDRSFSPKAFFEALKIIKAVSPSVVHSHASLSSRLASFALRVPSRIFTKHCSFGKSRRTFSSLFTGLINNLLSTCMIATSGSAKQELINMGCNEKKIVTVINGSEALPALSEAEKNDIRKKYGLQKDHFVIGYFARLEKYKGHKALISAAELCKHRYPLFRFLIVGAGSYEEELREYAKVLGVDDIVLFVGFHQDITPLFNITDVNVNCSYLSETSSLSLSEGMSLCIPSVASNCGGNTYMVKHGENGLIFDKNDPHSLFRALIDLYTDKELYHNCSLGAKERFDKELNARAMAEKMMRIYKKSKEEG